MLAALAAALGSACSDLSAATDEALRPQPDSAGKIAHAPLRLLVASDLEGVLEPCGCGDQPAGGADRLVAAVDRTREGARNVLVIAAGNWLYEPATLTSPGRAQDGWKADTAAAVLRQLEVDALIPGAADIELGMDRLKELARGSAAPVLLGTGADGKHGEPLAPTALLRTGEVRVGVSAATDAPLAGSLRPLGARRSDPSEAVLAHAQSLRARGATLFVAVVDGDESTAARIAEQLDAGGIVIQTGASADPPGVTPIGTRSLLVRAGKHGEGLLALDVWPAADRATGWRLLSAPPVGRARNAHVAVANYIVLDATAPRDAGVRALIDKLFARINAHNAAEPAETAADSSAGYVGSETCAACHTPAYFWWKGTSHGRAFETLVARGRQFDLDCVGCHVTGFDPRASRLISGIEQRKGVGCESCHGPGAAHAGNPRPPHRIVRRVVPESRCAACHDRDHSRGFEYATARLKLLGPGHGAATHDGER